MKEKKKETKKEITKIAVAVKEKGINPRGKIFEGKVISKFPKRIAIEFERMNYNRKYERYSKSRTKIHARVPIELEKEIQIGDVIQIRECRPLSKLIHFIVIKKIKGKEEK
ncbi:MAG: 30S ribosomal protein S17 [Candidatus Diapherotrites archaeon]|jgi:small subunit ribosomal protein S17|uniref:30S ribosomal protein S17 n=1 Tax=Candidatus Iainarchaeum sp. TaxID=3101447 RepID=A0A8T5GFT0_9ARCH|nr:30S ribosomal protein S17 [Candidatus Diapherotrites archaeon]